MLPCRSYYVRMGTLWLYSKLRFRFILSSNVYFFTNLGHFWLALLVFPEPPYKARWSGDALTSFSHHNLVFVKVAQILKLVFNLLYQWVREGLCDVSFTIRGCARSVQICVYQFFPSSHYKGTSAWGNQHTLSKYKAQKMTVLKPNTIEDIPCWSLSLAAYTPLYLFSFTWSSWVQ